MSTESSNNKSVAHSHAGHRQRLKQLFLDSGNFDNFQPHQVLELLLYYVIPQRDTNDIAHKLIDRFGSVEGVLNASVDELQEIAWIKQEASTYLKLFDALERYRRLNSNSVPVKLDKPEKVIEFLKPRYYGKKNEVSMITCVDRACNVMGCYTLLEGTINFTSINTRKVLETTIRSNAPCVILSHNHPVGSPNPSQSDVESTRAIIRLLSQVEVKVLDHVILSPNGEFSMAQSLKYAMMFN